MTLCLWLLLLLCNLLPRAQCFRSKGDDIIIVGGTDSSGGSGGPIIMDDGGKKGKGSTIIIIPPPPPSPFPRRDPFMDSMFGAASFETMPVMSQPPHMEQMQVVNQRPHQYMHPPPPGAPPPPYPRMSGNLMPPPPHYFGEPMPPPPSAKKKKKKKKSTSTTTTTTTTTPAPPQMAIHYNPPVQYPEQPSPSAFDNFYFTSENNNNNGYSNAQSSYNMPAMMKMMQQYAVSSENTPQVPEEPASSGSSSYDKGLGISTYEFPKIPQIIIKVPAPIVNVPQPIVNVPAAIVNVSVPEIRVPQALVTVPAPIVTVPAPIVNVPAANVTVNVPNIDVPPAIVNIPKKLVLKKEFRIATDRKPVNGMAVKRMNGNGYKQMADSEHIEFDDDEDENYSSAGSSHRQDKTTAEFHYAKDAAHEQHQQNLDYKEYGNDYYAPIRQTVPPASHSALVASGQRKKQRARLPPRSRDQRLQVDYRFQNQNTKQHSQRGYEKPVVVNYESPESTQQQQVSDIPDDNRLTPIQLHFSRSTPLQYQTPSTSSSVRPTQKLLSQRPRNFKHHIHHQQREQTHPAPQSPQFDDQPQPQQQDYTETPDQRQQDDDRQPHRSPGHVKSPSSSVTEKEVIEFLRNNNYKPMRSNSNSQLQVMRDDMKEPNIIFEKTESPLPESVSFESDQTILDDKSSNAPDPDPQNNQQSNDGIVFEDIPSHEFSVVAEGNAPASDVMMYDDQKDLAVYSTPMQPIVQHHQSHPNPNRPSSAGHQAASYPASPGASSAMANDRNSLIRRRRKMVRAQPEFNEESKTDTATAAENLDEGMSRNQHAPAAAT